MADGISPTMRGSRKFCQRGSNYDNVLIVDEERDDPNTTKTGHYRPASKTPLKWRFAGGPMMTQH